MKCFSLCFSYMCVIVAIFTWDQCQGKKVSFFILSLRVHITLLIIYSICSAGSILWCLFFRSVTNLIRSIESMKESGKHSSKLRKKLLSTMDEGKDFLFLFDLLAHTCGLESTLRVLTHSDETFYLICRPRLEPKNMLVLEEDKLKVMWSAADIEMWLQAGRKTSSHQKNIVIDSYEVTIFPAESVKNTHSVPTVGSRAHSRSGSRFRGPTTRKSMADIESTPTEIIGSDGSRLYSTWFLDLNGGRTEYVLTIACMIGKSRMKGEKVVTNLVPFGPERPRSGMVKSVNTKQAEIFWDPPKGEFTKYVLWIDYVESSELTRRQNSAGRQNSLSARSDTPNSSTYHLYTEDPDSWGIGNLGLRKMENLSYKLTTYTVLGLEAGECYRVTLATKTGNVVSRDTITDYILTMPNVVKGLRVTNITPSSCLLTWLLPEGGHTCLKGFLIQVRTHDGKMFKEVAVPRFTNSFVVLGLTASNDYDVSLTALCVYLHRRTESDKAQLSFTTVPEKVRNLHLDSSSPNSLTVSWDAPLIMPNVRFQLTISAATHKMTPHRNIDRAESDDLSSGHDGDVDHANALSVLQGYESSVEVAGDKTQHTFSRLPELVGSGCPYKIQIRVMATSPRELEVASDVVTETFMTKPLPPTSFHVPVSRVIDAKDMMGCTVCFVSSVTPYVNQHRIYWQPLHAHPDGNVSPAHSVAESSGTGVNMDTVAGAMVGSKEVISYTFKPNTLSAGRNYKVSVTAVTMAANLLAESDELAAKLEVRSDGEVVLGQLDTDLLRP